MGSRYGAKRGLVGYDKFRTGLTYAQVYEMLKDNSEDPKDWRHKTRGVILWHWHEMKMAMYERYLDAQASRKKKRRQPKFEPAPF